PEARPDGEDQIGFADPLLQLRVGPVAELAGIDAAAVRDCILSAERGGYSNAVAEREIGEMVRRAGAPVGPADDRDRVGGFLEQLVQRLDGSGVRTFGDGRNARPVDRLDLL